MLAVSACATPDLIVRPALEAPTAIAAPTLAQPACGPRAIMLDWLAANFREAPVALGVTTMGYLMELVTSPDGDTWTLMVTNPRGLSCLLAAGENWRPVVPKVFKGTVA